MMGFNVEAKFSPNNGADGKIPVNPDEWARFGVYNDDRAWNLLNYCYKILVS